WQQLTPDQRVAAVGYALMADNVKDGAVTAAKLADGAVTQSKMAAGAVTATALAPNAVKDNLAASGEGTVPSGAGLVSTSPNAPGLIAAGYQRVGVLNSGDDWTAIAGAGARDAAASVWTGTEFMIWGDGNQGWRYNPTTSVWTAMSTANQPLPRRNPLAVWTGTEMIVWAGSTSSGYFPSGVRYNPTTDSWTTMSVTNMPTPRNRTLASAVWTGTDMIIWGGFNGVALLDGARYTPQPGTGGVWNALPASGLEARYQHSATWTGSEMIVFGGTNGSVAFSNGARWNPTTGTWAALAAGPTARYLHTAVWTGTGLLVWGGNNLFASAPYGNGAVYSPINQNWTEMGSSGVPAARFHHSAVWSGTEMIVWGGSTSSVNSLVYTNTGASYNPVSGTWRSLTLNGAPGPRIQPLMAWTGLELLIYGGSNGAALGDGGRYRAGQTFYLYQRP
ncbi:MAG: hypothetical protein JWL81_2411, partial [Verrucomicrobiales bacterium]|nr:hypothetical protein [Verrucomicrobiales bacterium]